ncbi:hypothetical protein [Sphingorhabdus sp.]|uniref:hypothetical protein n=1 Tax=Sphingorhabdus sp. TaxID=1902408 RepID=UPI0037CBB4B0
MEYPNIVFCEHCGRASLSAIQIGGNYDAVTMRNNWQNCGYCGKMTKLPEGVFTSLRSAADALASHDNPIDRVDSLTRALSQVAKWRGYDTPQLEQLFKDAGIAQANELANSAPKDAENQKLWGVLLLGAIAYAWEKLPQGANSWLELFENVRALMGP